MLQLKCTGKVQALLKLKPEQLRPIAPCDTALGDWFVNEKTASSFVIYGIKQSNMSDIHTLFLNGLLKFLMLQDVPSDKIDVILKSYHELALTKTDNRSLMGTMNELAFHYDHAVYYEHGYKHCDLNGVIQSLNRIPFKALGFKYPVELLRSIVAQL
ncbi:MAG: DUF6933 domain-containing protein [Formosimonas sp.]